MSREDYDEDSGISRRGLLTVAGSVGAGYTIGEYLETEKTREEAGETVKEPSEGIFKKVEEYLSNNDYDTETASLTVEEETDPSFSEYRNDEGVVDTGGLQNAINDFIRGEIGTGGLQDVINEFLVGQ